MNTATNETICEMIVNHSMTLDEAIEICGGEIINDMADPRWSDDGDNVIFDDVRYWYEDLEVLYD